MTFGDLKENVLKLIFSYSVAGTQIPATYNNQADYIAMIPGLANSAEMEIATTVRRIPAEKKLSSLTVTHETYCDVYALPDDCWQVMHGGLLCPDRIHRFREYRVMLDGSLRVGRNTDPDLILEYWRYPDTVGASTADTVELDNTPDAHEAIVFYVAAGRLTYDDAYRAQMFRNEYELRKKSLKEPVWLEVGHIVNCYGRE